MMKKKYTTPNKRDRLFKWFLVHAIEPYVENAAINLGKATPYFLVGGGAMLYIDRVREFYNLIIFVLNK
ncbi:hypothetical protein HGA91_01840 [candidate division WWE3 bacterium]|nr:hypothetical protein [candidate division WWE3 bacterium]